MFLPNLPEYVVGRGRQQRTIGNYDEALAALQRLAEPIWKKPKPGGGWTAFRVTEWPRIGRAELDRRALD